MPEVQKIAYIGDNLMERCWLCPDEEISLKGFLKFVFVRPLSKKVVRQFLGARHMNGLKYQRRHFPQA